MSEFFLTALQRRANTTRRAAALRAGMCGISTLSFARWVLTAGTTCSAYSTHSLTSPCFKHVRGLCWSALVRVLRCIVVVVRSLIGNSPITSFFRLSFPASRNFPNNKPFHLNVRTRNHTNKQTHTHTQYDALYTRPACMLTNVPLLVRPCGGYARTHACWHALQRKHSYIAKMLVPRVQKPRNASRCCSYQLAKLCLQNP